MWPLTEDEFAQWRRQDSFTDLADGSWRQVASASPKLRLSLDASSFVIREDSPPHAQLATPTCSKPGEQIPPLIGSLAAVLQRCVHLNAAASAEAAAAYPLLAADLVGGSCSPAAQTQQLSSWQHQLRSQQQLECQRYQQRLRQPAMRARETEFHGLRVPPISIAAYLRRIAQYAKCSPVCFVMAHSYIERLAKMEPALVPGPLNVHRMLTVGILLAAKLMDDRYFNNAYYAKIGGLGLVELNALELQMMARLQYSLRVSGAEVAATLTRLTRGASSSAADFAAAFPSLLLPSAMEQMAGRAAAAPYMPPRQSSMSAPTCPGIHGAASVPSPSELSASPAAVLAGAAATSAVAAAAAAPAASSARRPSTAAPADAKLAPCAPVLSPLEQPGSIMKRGGGTEQPTTSATAAVTDVGTKSSVTRLEPAKVLSVRFSDEHHVCTTALTAAALSAASLAEEPDSSRWRASMRSSSVASIGSSGGSSCHRAAIDITVSAGGSISAC